MLYSPCDGRGEYLIKSRVFPNKLIGVFGKNVGKIPTIWEKLPASLPAA
jgi:hypothetical protein